jgi:molybdopterin converting factor small subunit
MSVTMNLPSVLAGHTGGARTIQATGRTLGEVVADVAARYPGLAPRLRDEQGKPYAFVNFYLNDEDVRFRGGFAAPLQDGDEVTVIPAIAGG